MNLSGDNSQSPASFGPAPPWSLVTSHGLVLLYVATHPDATIREISITVEVTERRVASIISDLAKANLIKVRRLGRKNQYCLQPDARFGHHFIADVRFDDFVGLWRASCAGHP